jgi:hypothetical protein
MRLGDKMFTRSTTVCPIRSDCQRKSDKKYFDSLFEQDWEVLVIRRDEQGAYNWSTWCCDSAVTKH